MTPASPVHGDGPRLIVTRPPPQADAWVARLAAAGLDAVALPLLSIGPPADPRAVTVAWQALPGAALAMFVSPNAAARFLAARPRDRAWPAGVLAGATGPGTAEALVQAGVPAAAIVQPPVHEGVFDSEALWRVLKPLRDWRDTEAWIVRGEGGREWLAEALRAEGAAVHFVAAYRREPARWTADDQALAARALAWPRAHVWLLSSGEAVDHLRRFCPGADWSAARAVASHPRIAERARAIGMVGVQVLPPTVDALVAAFGRP
ncbi:uroporphyrinogen-III synthase [Aquabacterium sp. J223]|uniref:uroporphyrinogen-III synthase n=1 Tax=Aquabacterium sp. J223 TaxID=2898431 RepID=UPI0021AD91D1|nr:uroporphyrinogen-III synthase [Aquabacterium sp. J223]UUX94937.1 uroporphyrinogen-III synthase [Aquabacterium sp. J223]